MKSTLASFFVPLLMLLALLLAAIHGCCCAAATTSTESDSDSDSQELFWMFYATPIGSGKPGYTDSHDPSQVQFDGPIGVVVHEPTHDIYVAEMAGRIRKISNATGEVSTVLTLAQGGITDMTFLNTTSQTLIFSHAIQHCLKSIDLDSPNEPPQVFAGICGTAGFQDQTRLTSQFYYPTSIAFAPSARYDCTLLWIVDGGNKVIRFVNMTTDDVFSVLYGNFDPPVAVVWARQGGLVLAINRTCVITVDIEIGLSFMSAGSCTEAGTADGYSDEARLNKPRRLALDANSEALFITDDNGVRMTVTQKLPDGHFVQVVRSLEYRNEGGPPAYSTTYGIGAISGKKIFVADYYGSRIWRLDLCPFRYWRDIDGDGFGDISTGICVYSTSAPDGYVSNYLDCDDSSALVHPNQTEDCYDGIDNNCDGVIDGRSTGPERPIPFYNTTSTYAGSGSLNATDGPLLDAGTPFPLGLAYDPRTNLVYFGSWNQGMRVIDPVKGTVNTMNNAALGDQQNQVMFMGLAIDGDTMYVADAFFNCIRMLNITDPGASQPWLNTIIGLCNHEGSGSAEGPYAQVRLYSPMGVLVDPTAPGHLFIVDSSNNCIRRATYETATVETFAGTCGYQYNGTTNGDKLQAKFSFPFAMAYHAHSASFLISDSFNHCIRSINASGYVSTVAGACVPDGGSFFEGPSVYTARFNQPRGIAVDPKNGMVYIIDGLNYRIRRIDLLEGTVTAVAGTGYSSLFQTGPNATFLYPLAVVFAPHSNGSLLVSDINRIRMIECASAEYYVDEDGDGYPNATNVVSSCYHRTNYFPVATANPCLTFDCDDSDASVNVKRAFRDADEDGWGDPYNWIYTCSVPSGYTLYNNDCNDTTALQNPGRTEECDDIDNDCNDLVDDGLPMHEYYRDNDRDGLGNAQHIIKTCHTSAPDGYAEVPYDCDDNDPLVKACHESSALSSSSSSPPPSSSRHNATITAVSITIGVLICVVLVIVVVLVTMVTVLVIRHKKQRGGNMPAKSESRETLNGSSSKSSLTDVELSDHSGRTDLSVSVSNDSQQRAAVAPTANSHLSAMSKLEIQESEIKITGRIGKGAFGIVYKGEYEGISVAVKTFDISDADDEVQKRMVAEFENEVNVLYKLRHANILAFMGALITSSKLSIVTEFMECGSLYDWLHKKGGQRLFWKQKLSVLRGAARGFAFMHGSKILHRDIKSQNILLTNGKVSTSHFDPDRYVGKVADVGLSKFKQRSGDLASIQVHTQLVGTMLWMAPEVAEGETYGLEADVYSFGITMYEALEELLPYHHVAQKVNIHIRVANSPSFRPLVMSEVDPASLPPHYADQTPECCAKFIALMKRCWQHSPADRPPFSSIVSELEAMLLM